MFRVLRIVPRMEPLPFSEKNPYTGKTRQAYQLRKQFERMIMTHPNGHILQDSFIVLQEPYAYFQRQQQGLYLDQAQLAHMRQYLQNQADIALCGSLLRNMVETLSPRVMAEVEAYWVQRLHRGCDNRDKARAIMNYLKDRITMFNLPMQTQVMSELELDKMGVAENENDVREVMDQITSIRDEMRALESDLTMTQMKMALFRRLPDTEFYSALQTRTSNPLMPWETLQEIFLKAFMMRVERATTTNNEERGQLQVVNNVSLQQQIDELRATAERESQQRRQQRHQDLFDRGGRSGVDEYGNHPSTVQLVAREEGRGRSRSNERDGKRERSRSQDRISASPRSSLECREYTNQGKCTHEARTGNRCKYAHVSANIASPGLSPRSGSRSPDRSGLQSMVPARTANTAGRPSTPAPTTDQRRN